MNRYFKGIAFLVLIWSGCSSNDDLGPEALLTELGDQRRFASTDQLADWLIQKDPSILLVDVRPHEEYDAYSLPGAINIPLANLLSPEEQALLNCEDYRLIFYSNGTVLAEKAWVITRRLGCASSLILKGGLNEWTSTILTPKEPPVTASREEWNLYQLRKAAGLYFAGGSKSLEAEPFIEPQRDTPRPAAEKTVPLQPKKVEAKVEEEEGC